MRSLAICVVLLTVAASAQNSGTSSAGPYQISGTVVNASTGQVLSKIAVSIGPAESNSGTTIVTADDGRFTFDKLKRGKYWLQAQGHGFSPQRFDQHEEFSTAIAVGPDLDSEHLVFRLRPAATITGTITDDQNEPVTQASVMLFRTGLENGANTTEMRGQSNTDDQGAFHFGHVAPGSYYIAVSARPWYAENLARFQRSSGNFDSKFGRVSETLDPQFDVTYPITYYPGVTDPSAATPLAVKPGDRAVADIELTAVPALHIRVRDSSVDPSQGFGMNATQRVLGSVSIPVQMSFNVVGPGEYEISGIPPGQFALNLQTWGKNPTNREEEINVTDNSEVDASSASASASVSGVVQLDSGQPVSNPAFVQLFDQSDSDRLAARISAKGEFEFNASQVRPGTYQVFVGDVQEALVKSIAASGATTVGDEVQIGAGAAVQLKIILSQGVGRIDGTALKDDKPFAGAMIVLVPEDIEHNSGLVRRDQSDSDGTFTLYNVLPGKYTVAAIQNGWDLPWLSPGVLQPYLKTGSVVNVIPREKYDIKVNVQ